MFGFAVDVEACQTIHMISFALGCHSLSTFDTSYNMMQKLFYFLLFNIPFLHLKLYPILKLKNCLATAVRSTPNDSLNSSCPGMDLHEVT